MAAIPSKKPKVELPQSKKPGGAASLAAAAPPPPEPASAPADGGWIVATAEPHINEQYVFGARAPMANANWKGPWDCAEFASWCVYQACGVLYGVRPADDAVRADAYTGYWSEQAERDRATVPIEDAVRIPGACLLRKPGGDSQIGHIAISTGDGKTVEAYSTKRGVIASTASDRRWDYGILVPGVSYFMNEKVVKLKQPEGIIRLTTPLMRGKGIEKIQAALAKAGYAPGSVDGVYGPQTASAVMRFQADNGLVADGEVGATTKKALNV